MKDPAFLFYSSDFLTGTMFLSNEEVGIYIRLLCVQHQKGYVTLSEVKSIAKSCDVGAIITKFQSKQVEGIGMVWFNERLQDEVTKRNKYSESRRNNRLSKSISANISNTYVQHMENENENENRNVIGNEVAIVVSNKARPKNVEEVIEYFATIVHQDSANDEGNKFYDHFSSNGWKVSGKAPMKDWKASVRNWVRNSKTIIKLPNENGTQQFKVGRFDSQDAQRVLRDLNKFT